MVKNFLNLSLFIFALAFLFFIFKDEKEIQSVEVSILPKEQKEVVLQKSLDIEYKKEEVNSQVLQSSEKKRENSSKKRDR